MNASEVHCIDIRSIKYQNLYKPLFCWVFFQPFDPLEINDGQPLAAKLRIMALLSELEKEMEEKFDRVCIQQFV